MQNDEVQKLIDQQERISKLMKSISDPFANNPALKVMERLHKMTEPKWKYESFLPEPIAKDLLEQADFLKQLEPSPQWKEIMRQIEPLTRQFAGIHESEAMRSIRLASESFLASFESSGIHELIRKASSSFSGADFQLIHEMANSPFNLSGNELLSYGQELADQIKHDNDSTVTVDFIKNEVSTTKDFSKLATIVQLCLVWMILTALEGIVGGLAHDQFNALTAEEVQAISPPITTPEKARKYSRNPVPGISLSSLQDIRIVTGSSLNLRESPSIKAKVILELPVGKLLDVLDRGNRTWLYVGVTIDGEYLEGWVSRRYTTTFK